jgi:uncharacterized protein (DUF2336 family)
MAVPASLIPELDAIVYGPPGRCAATLERIADLFVEGANGFSEDHIQLFDDVLSRLVAKSDANARARLSYRLAPLANAPIKVVGRLAGDGDIAVARPILEQSPRVAEEDLVVIAATKKQAHLLAIAGRRGIGEAVTDVLVRRGDRQVAHRVANNRDARLSSGSFLALVERAKNDDVLAVKLARRPDVPVRSFRDLVLDAPELGQRRLFAIAGPETRAQMRHVLAEAPNRGCATNSPRDYSAAQRAIELLRQQNKLDEAALVAFARTGQFKETVAALASLCAVPLAVVDRLMSADRPDPVLILAKSAGWAWPTAKAVIMAVPGGDRKTNKGLEAAYAIYERLSPATAQRIVLFWKLRWNDG